MGGGLYIEMTVCFVFTVILPSVSDHVAMCLIVPTVNVEGRTQA